MSPRKQRSAPKSTDFWQALRAWALGAIGLVVTALLVGLGVDFSVAYLVQSYSWISVPFDGFYGYLVSGLLTVFGITTFLDNRREQIGGIALRAVGEIVFWIAAVVVIGALAGIAYHLIGLALYGLAILMIIITLAGLAAMLLSYIFRLPR